MDDHPDFVFACSSAQQFAWIKEHYPELFARIRRQGRGGPVRARRRHVGRVGHQHARRRGDGPPVRRRASGSSSRSSASTPRRSGCRTRSATPPRSRRSRAAAGARWFLTQKISWNQTNRMPHHTFWWEGIDGTADLHPLPAGRHLQLRAVRRRSWPTPSATSPSKGRATISLVPFGYGDGGGGPTREMLAAARRHGRPRGLADGCGSARPRAFFRGAEAEYPDAAGVGRARCTWSCTAAPTPRRPAPSRATAAASTCCGRPSCGRRRRPCAPGADYPYDELERLWRIVLLQQFHDILPGTLDRLGAPRGRAPATPTSPGSCESLIERRLRDAGRRRASGSSRSTPGRSRVTACRAWPPDAAVRTAARRASPPSRTAWRAEPTGFTLDNGMLRLRVDDRRAAGLPDRSAVRPRGDRRRARSATCCSCTGTSPINGTPGTSTRHYRRTVTDLDSAGSVRLDRTPAGEPVIVVTRRFGASRIEQRITPAAGARAACGSPPTSTGTSGRSCSSSAFPLDVRADRSASETQFGHVFRPTHTNTSWEPAKFEICAHRWMHVAEPGLRRGRRQRLHLRPRRHPRPADRRRRPHHRPAVAAAGTAVPRSRTPTRAGTPSRCR